MSGRGSRLRVGLPRPSGAAVALCLALAASAVAGPALGGPPEDARAEALFREGRDAIDKQDWASACSKFRESLALTKRPVTLLNLAVCEEKLGHPAVAAQSLEAALALPETTAERAELARKELARLDAKLARVTFRRGAGAPADLGVAVDGAPVDVAFGAIRLEPGTHVVTVAASGHAEATIELVLEAGATRDVELVVGPATTTAAPSARAAPPPRDAPAPGGGGTRRTLGFVVGGVGVASLGVGVATGILTIGKKSEVDDNCVHGCNDSSRDAANAGKTLSTISTITFAVGAAAVGVGVFLVLTGGEPKPSGAATATVVGPVAVPGGGSVRLVRTF